MQEINFVLTSLCPMKMDKWVDGKQPTTEEGYVKQAKLKAYRDKRGNLCIPSEAVKASIKMAANELVGIRKGKAMRQTIRALLNVEPENLTMDKKKYDLLAKDIVTRKGTGDKVTRVPTYRPLVKEWKIEGTIKLIYNELNPDFIKQCVELAGIKYGLLSHRPEFGKFEITKWEVKK